MILEREMKDRERREGRGEEGVFHSFSPNPKNRENPERKKKQRKRYIYILIKDCKFCVSKKERKRIEMQIASSKKTFYFLTFRHLFFRKI